MTMFVNLNIVSARLSVNASIGARRFSSVSIARADAEQHGEDDDLEHLGFGDGAGDVLGEDVEDDLLPGALAPAAPSPSGGGDGGRLMPTPARLIVIAAQPIRQRQGRHHLEIDQGLDPHPSDLPQVGVPGDADDQRGEDQGGDDRPDQADEDLAEDAEGQPPGLGEVVADLGTDHHRYQDPGRERLLRPRVDQQHHDGGPARGEEGGLRSLDEAEEVEEREDGGDEERQQRGQNELGHRQGVDRAAGPGIIRLYFDVPARLNCKLCGSGGIGRRASLRS